MPLRDAITLFVPTIERFVDEETFLSEHPQVLLKEGRFNKVAMIAGVNSEEGLLTSAGNQFFFFGSFTSDSRLRIFVQL